MAQLPSADTSSEASAQLGQPFGDPKQIEPLDEDIPEDQEARHACLRNRFHRPSDHCRIGGQVDDLELAALFIVLGAECTGQRRHVWVRAEIDRLVIQVRNRIRRRRIDRCQAVFQASNCELGPNRLPRGIVVVSARPYFTNVFGFL